MTDLPLIRLHIPWTDDDAEFHSDMLYFRGLLDELYEMCFFGAKAKPFPCYLSVKLANARDYAKATPVGVPDFDTLVRPWI